MGQPGLIFRDGFQYAFASFYAITIPLTGVILLKRQWILGKHFGYVTPGEMLVDHYKGNGIRTLTVTVDCRPVVFSSLLRSTTGGLRQAVRRTL